MSGLDLLLDVCTRGARFYLDDEREVMVNDPGLVVSGPERVLLRAIRFEIRSLLLTELPDDPGADVCATFVAAPGVAACRRCARGIAEHFWRRAGLRETGCAYPVGAAGEACRQCGAAAAEHVAP